MKIINNIKLYKYNLVLCYVVCLHSIRFKPETQDHPVSWTDGCTRLLL